MDRALAVVDDTETDRRLLAEAGALAGGVGAELVVLTVFDADEFASETQRKADKGLEVESVEAGTDRATETAREIAASVLSDTDVEYEPVGIVGDRPDDILAAARNRDCDHVFIAGRKRSPTGKAIFGDVAQAVVLNFEGPVSVLTDGA